MSRPHVLFGFILLFGSTRACRPVTHSALKFNAPASIAAGADVDVLPNIIDTDYDEQCYNFCCENNDCNVIIITETKKFAISCRFAKCEPIEKCRMEQASEKYEVALMAAGNQRVRWHKMTLPKDFKSHQTTTAAAESTTASTPATTVQSTDANILWESTKAEPLTSITQFTSTTTNTPPTSKSDTTTTSAIVRIETTTVKTFFQVHATDKSTATTEAGATTPGTGDDLSPMVTYDYYNGGSGGGIDAFQEIIDELEKQEEFLAEGYTPALLSSPEAAANSSGSSNYDGSSANETAKSRYPGMFRNVTLVWERSNVYLVIVAAFSVLFVCVAVGLLLKRGIHEWWNHRKYQKLDNLINGVYE